MSDVLKTNERIDHAAEARKHIDWAHTQQEQDGEFEFSVRDNALIAQAEATLALVEQQRIANLIALGSAEHGPYRYLDVGLTDLKSMDALGSAAVLLGIELKEESK